MFLAQAGAKVICLVGGGAHFPTDVIPATAGIHDKL